MAGAEKYYINMRKNILRATLTARKIVYDYGRSRKRFAGLSKN
jgi:hypothetical protein